ncbi:serine hydrolase domain-containing protein [Sediminivirga luteola]|uniref:serine hydrolase domain-containing protein n=1 Tax=Sediminivirga luteola TaxID=1774748 RepID=UPI00166A318F|nr:serine hydrolase domain-containing protein [Sediminivirga luteola]MCI2264432.1 beta-lactamase family protein [Sediminivirga luteola]
MLAFNDAGLPGPAFEALTGTFRTHLQRARGGMAFTVYRAGAPVARFYGGSRTERPSPDDPVRDPWTPDTMTVLFSGTKGLVATLAAVLAGRGELDVRVPVARYWPEFAANGKEDVRVWHLLSHTVGLPYVDPEPAGEWAVLDNAANARALAAQRPLWEPGTRVAYHAITYGYLMTELLRRITGKDVGALLAEELAQPLGLDVHLGLPESLDSRVAPVFRGPDYAISTFLEDPERRRIVERMYRGTLLGGDLFNTPQLRRGQLAAGGAVGTADAMARLYSRLAVAVSPVARGRDRTGCADSVNSDAHATDTDSSGSSNASSAGSGDDAHAARTPGNGPDGTGTLVHPDALAQATREWAEGVDAINDRPLRFGLGFELDDSIGTYGPVRPAFGHSGAGGGLHGAWPEHGIGFSFLSNEMLAENKDSRAKDLLTALARVL